MLLKANQVFSNAPRNLSINPLNCTILDSQIFENFILADELFAKALQILEICVWVNIKLCWKLASSLLPPTAFDESFKVTWVVN